MAVSNSAVKLMKDVVLKCLMFHISLKCHHVPGISNHIAKSFINPTIFFSTFILILHGKLKDQLWKCLKIHRYQAIKHMD